MHIDVSGLFQPVLSHRYLLIETRNGYVSLISMVEHAFLASESTKHRPDSNFNTYHNRA